MTRRPLPLRLLPERLRGALWARFYHRRAAQFPELFAAAPLRFAPEVTMDLVPGDVISSGIAFTGFWELHLSRLLAKLARQGGVMVDVGANLGYFGLLWAAGNPANRCISFEASPRNIRLLRGNVARNGVEQRIEIVPLAAGREAGQLFFDAGPDDQTGWGGFAESTAPGAIAIDVVRVDEIVPPDVAVKLLKIDIEGADTWALMGCERLLREKRVEHIWFEQNRPRMKNLGIREGEAQDYLSRLGYRAAPRTDPRADVVDWIAQPG